MIVDLIYNVSVLVALSSFSGFIDTKFQSRNYWGKIIQGLLFGITSIIGMMYPFRLDADVIFDGRSIVISLCTLFYGPVSGAIASLMAILYRLNIGGGGALTGILVISASFLIGNFYNIRSQKIDFKYTKTNLYVFGLIVSSIMMLLMLTLPTNSILKAYKTVTMTVMAAYPVITMIIGKMLLDHIERAKAEEIIKEDNRILSLTKKELTDTLKHLDFHLYNTPLAVVQFDKNFRIIKWSKKAEDIFGWSEKEIIGKNVNEIRWIVEEERERIEKLINDMKNGSNTSNITINKNYTKEGDIRTCAWYNSCMNDESGGLISIYSLVEDITEKIETQLAFKNSEKRYSNFINHSSEGIYRIDFINEININLPEEELLKLLGHSAVIGEVNESFAQMYGHTKEEMIGRLAVDFAPDHSKRVLKLLKSPNMKLPYSENLDYDKNGSAIYLAESCHAEIEDGKLKSIWGMQSNITERKKLETELMKLSIAVEQSPASIIITDLKGNIEYANRKAIETTGYNKDELIGKNPRILKSGFTSDKEYEAMWVAINSGNSWQGNFHNKRKNGELYWEYAQISPLKNFNNTISNYLAIKKDITEEVIKEKELESYRNHLEELVEFRTIEIETINKQLHESLEKEQELSKLKSRFISTASHEFRTPLTSISTSAELIQRYYDKWSKEKIIEHLTRIQNSTSTLTKLMDDVLKANKAESGKTVLELVNTNIQELCKKIIDDAEVYLKEGQKLIFDFLGERKSYQIDSKQFEIIINNLLSNAIKYSLSDGVIRFIVETENSRIRISVIDSGIGIPEEDLPHLFEPFHRSKNTKDIQGTGLGLSLVKHAVELHGGKISVYSKENLGTKITVEIPVNENQITNALENS